LASTLSPDRKGTGAQAIAFLPRKATIVTLSPSKFRIVQSDEAYRQRARRARRAERVETVLLVAAVIAILVAIAIFALGGGHGGTP
jgi:hypothetical protein